MSRIPDNASTARELLTSDDLHERAEAVSALGAYGDSDDVDLLITAQQDPGDQFNSPDVMFWRAGFALEEIARRLAESGTARDVPVLLKLIQVDLSVEAAINSLLSILKKYAASIALADLEKITQLDDEFTQRRSRPVKEMDYEDNETYWEPVSCLPLKEIAYQELELRRASSEGNGPDGS